MEFNELYAMASGMAKEEKIEEHTYISEVAVAILSTKKKVYIGKSIKTTCSLGLCAEMVAMSDMILHGETEIEKMVAVYQGGNIISPCGKCREFLYQMNHKNLNAKIMLGKNRIVSLKELLPDTWSDMKNDE